MELAENIRMIEKNNIPNSNSNMESGIETDTEKSNSNSKQSTNEITVTEMERSTKKQSQVVYVDCENEGVKFMGLEDNDSICSSITDDGRPEIPDGGWGWMVVFSSFIISMIADGISFSFGLLYIEFLDHFQASKSRTAWIGSLFIAVPLLSGPVMSALVDKYGCRSMTMLGGIIATIGFLLSSISNSIEAILLSFGIIAGLGLGLVYVTAVVSIAYWFDRKRTLAVGLGACGTGVGTFIYAPMSQYFIEEYGWRGTIMLLAGTLLNLCVCGAIMRDPEWWILEQKKQLSRSKGSSQSISGRSGGGESQFPGVEELKSLMKSGETPEYILTQLATSIINAENLESTTKMNSDCKVRSSSLISLPTFLKQSERVPIEVIESLSANKNLYNIILENYPSLLNFRSNSEQKLPTEKKESNHNKPVTMSMKLKAMTKDKSIDVPETTADLIKMGENKIVKQSSKESECKNDWFKRQFSVNYHYLRDIKVHRNCISHRSAMTNISKYRLRASSCPNIYRNSMIYINEEKKWYISWLDTIKTLFDFSMFLELHFLLMNTSTVLLFVWFIVPYFYLAEHMTRCGYEEEAAAKLLSIIGITNTIGMVSLGWAGDQPWMHVTKSYSACLILCGITVGIYPLITPYYWALLLNSALFGLFFASTFSFTPGILVELIPLERFTTGYGLILLSQGIGHLIGPPLSGMIFDLTNQWDIAFYMAGIWIVVSGLFILIIPLTNNVKLFSRVSKDDIERVSHESEHGSYA